MKIMMIIIMMMIRFIPMLTFPAHDELGMCWQVLFLQSSRSCASIYGLAVPLSCQRLQGVFRVWCLGMSDAVRIPAIRVSVLLYAHGVCRQQVC